MDFYKSLVPSIEFIITIGRTINLEKTARYGKFSSEFLENAAICLMHPKDLKRLGMTEGNVKITTKAGSVVVKVINNEYETSEGLIVIPNSPWVNQLVSEEDFQQNKIWFNATVETTKEEIKPLKEILAGLGEGN